jgi:biopolymer transport protein ExbD
MTKVKMPRGSTAIDMTPMVDMAFLLVTFFILTTQFRPDEPVQVATPGAHSLSPIKEHGKITITVAPDGRVFFDLDNQNIRRDLIQKMGETYGIKFNEDEINAFALGSSIGIPIQQLKQYLDMDPTQRKNVVQPGIPVDSTENMTNELSAWIKNGRYAGLAAKANPQILVKGDSKSNYPAIKNVFVTLQKQKALTFGLITSDEGAAPVDISK